VTQFEREHASAAPTFAGAAEVTNFDAACRASSCGDHGTAEWNTEGFPRRIDHAGFSSQWMRRQLNISNQTVSIQIGSSEECQKRKEPLDNAGGPYGPYLALAM